MLLCIGRSNNIAESINKTGQYQKKIFFIPRNHVKRLQIQKLYFEHILLYPKSFQIFNIFINLVLQKMSQEGDYTPEKTQNSFQSFVGNSNERYSFDRMQWMYSYPAVIEKAKMHAKANEFGYNSKKLKNGKNVPICPCCELPINTYRIQMNYGTTPKRQKVIAGKPIFLLNTGTSMFFTFIKMTIIYLFIRFLLSDCYNLLTNIMSNNCDQQVNAQQCDNNIVARFSSYNKNYDQGAVYSDIVDIINLVTVILSLVFFVRYRRLMYHVYEVAEVSQVSQSDYTIFVENIPYFLPSNRTILNQKMEVNYQRVLSDLFTDKIYEWRNKLKQPKYREGEFDDFFYKKMQTKPFIQQQPIVCSISLCFDLTELEKMNKIREELMAKHNQDVQNEQKYSQQPVHYQISRLNHSYIQLCRTFSDHGKMAFSLSHFVGKAFVSFQYEHYKEYIMGFKGTDKLKIAGRPLKLGTAANPSDVYWFNMKISSRQRIMAIIYSAFILFMGLTFAFAALFALQYVQLLKTTPQKTDKITEEVVLSYIFTITMSILTTLINKILATFCQKLTQQQRYATTTDRIFSLMVKSVLSQFINTAFIYYVFSIVSHITHPDKTDPLNQNGLVMKVTSLVAVSGAVSIGLNAVQIGSIFTCLLNKYKLKGNTQTVNMFQVELNKKIQDPQFDFADRYSYYIVNVFVISFFSYITPYVSIIQIVIFIIQYWVDKYNLFRRFSCPIDFDFRLSRMTIKFFQYSILVFAIGNYIFGQTIHTSINDQYQIINLISIAFAALYCLVSLFSKKKWFEKIDDPQSLQNQSYHQSLNKQKFKKVYWLENPATSFAQERELNIYGNVVNYGGLNRFADEKDYEEFIKDQKLGQIDFETYDIDDQRAIARDIGIQEQIIVKLLTRKQKGERDVQHAAEKAH